MAWLHREPTAVALRDPRHLVGLAAGRTVLGPGIPHRQAMLTWAEDYPSGLARPRAAGNARRAVQHTCAQRAAPAAGGAMKRRQRELQGL